MRQVANTIGLISSPAKRAAICHLKQCCEVSNCWITVGCCRPSCPCRSPGAGTHKSSADPEVLDAKYKVLQAAAEDLLAVSELLPDDEHRITDALAAKLEALQQQYKALYDAGRMSDVQAGGSGQAADRQSGDISDDDADLADDGQSAKLVLGSIPMCAAAVEGTTKNASGHQQQLVISSSEQDAEANKHLSTVRASEKRLPTAERAAALAGELRELHVSCAQALLELCHARCMPGALHPGSASVKSRFEASQEVKQWQEALVRLHGNADICQEQLDAVSQAAGYDAAGAKVAAGRMGTSWRRPRWCTRCKHAKCISC